MNIKVLGSGCAKCQQLEKTVKEALNELGENIQVEHVTDIKKIMEYRVLATPGLVIDDKVVSSGKVPTKAEVASFITTALARQS